MYKKRETRMKHDKARQIHMDTIIKLQKKIVGMEMGSNEWKNAMSKLNTYFLQLLIYDKEMGYSPVSIQGDENGKNH